MSEADTDLEHTTRRPDRRAYRDTVLVAVWRGIALLLVLILWHLAASQKWVTPVLARSPVEVWVYLRQASASGELWGNTLATLYAVFLAWALASASGVVVGLALGLMPRVERVLNPFLDAINSMPRIALAPIFIIYFGINTSAKVALGFSIVFFMAVSAARAGVRSADADILRLSVVMGASKLQLFSKVLLPVAAPAIFAVLRLGLIYSLLGVIASELMASRNGLGQLIANYSGQFRMDAVYGILIVLMIIAAVMNQMLTHVEGQVFRWLPPSDR